MLYSLWVLTNVQWFVSTIIVSHRIVLLGNCWRKLPASARHNDTHLHELSHNCRSQWETWCCHRNLSGRIQEGPKGGRRYQPIISPANLLESFALESTLAERCAHHQERPWVRPNMGQARGLARNNPETHPITRKPETVSHVAEQFSWIPLPSCSLPRRPFPIKSFALSACVSPQTHFWVDRKSVV